MSITMESLHEQFLSKLDSLQFNSLLSKRAMCTIFGSLHPSTSKKLVGHNDECRIMEIWLDESWPKVGKYMSNAIL